MDLAYVDSFGLGYQSLFTTQGIKAAERFDEILDIIVAEDRSINHETKTFLADQLTTWGSIISPELRMNVFSKSYQHLLDVIERLALSPDDDDPSSDNEYAGKLIHAYILSNMLSNVKNADISQAIAALVTPSAYLVLEHIFNQQCNLGTKSAFTKASAATMRSDTIVNLLKVLPYTGAVNIPNAMTVFRHAILDPNVPASIKSDACSLLSSLGRVNKDSIKNSGNDVIRFAFEGNHPEVITIYATMPELYTNSPEAVHDHIDKLLSLNSGQTLTLFHQVSSNYPVKLVPYLSAFISRLETDTMFGSMYLLIIQGIAGADPTAVYPNLATISALAKNINQSSITMVRILGYCSKATEPNDAADKICLELVTYLSNDYDNSTITTSLVEISNLLPSLSSIDVITPHMPTVVKFKSLSEIVVTSIEDHAAGLVWLYSCTSRWTYLVLL
jgi:hypothetical protein